MALSKAQLKEILSKAGVSEDNMSAAVKEIMAGHEASIEALQEERDNYKDSASKYESEHKRAEDLEKKLKDANESNKDSYKVKYDAIKEEFAEYKKSVEAEKTKTTKTEAFKAFLKEIGISEKRIDSVTKVSDIDGLELDENGKITGCSGKSVKEYEKALKEEWSDFIVKEDSKGANVANPPANNGGGAKTKEEIMKIKDTQERQKAWGEFIAAQQKG
jgi:hypothetical protein